jgi:hypothetical protein
MMELSQADDMAHTLKTWVEKLAESAEGKAALDTAGLFIAPQSKRRNRWVASKVSLVSISTSVNS